MQMSNNSSSSWNVTRHFSQTELTIWIAVHFGLGLLGALLIIILMVVISRSRKLKSGSELLITHALAIDLLYCLIVNPVINIPIYLKQTRQVAFPYDCVFVNFFMLLFIYAGNWTAVVLAINRLFAIVFPYLYGTITSKRFSISLLVFIWSVAFSCNIPSLNLVPGLANGMLPSGACGLVRNEGVTFTVLGAIGTYLPIALLGTIYIGLFLISHFRKNSSSISDNQKSILTRRLSIAKALFLTFVWYCICTLPPPILTMFYAEWWRSEARLLLYSRTAQVLGYAASPIFFFGMNAEYRRALGKMLRRASSSVHKPEHQARTIRVVDGSDHGTTNSPENKFINLQSMDLSKGKVRC